MSRVVAWVLVALWVVVSVVAVLGTADGRGYRELAATAEAREVREVTVIGDFGRSGRGSGTVRIEWREHLLLRSTTVVAARPTSAASDDGFRGTRPVLAAPVADTLAERFPALEVRTSDRSATDRGALWALLGGAVAVWTALLVASTPKVVRATRWAWFWLLFVVPPLGPLAFLLLGGPTGLVPAREDGRRLTGGWAFVLMLFLGGGGLFASQAA